MKKIPSSVYHLQVGKNLSLKRAIQLIPYLHELGIDGICCSPLFESFDYGYDVTNSNLFNPDLGTPKDLKEFFSQLKRYGIKHIFDVVPNHMGIKGDKNIWWMDVLEKGPKSAFADFFDINWNPKNKEHKGKVILPILGQSLDTLVEKGEIQFIWNEGVWIHYHEYLAPLSSASYPLLCRDQKKKKNFACSKKQLVALYQKSHAVQDHINELLSQVNKNPNLIHEVLKKQFYVLADWRSSEQERNYRRFFNINDLVAVHIENIKVFNAHHRLIFDLIRQGHVQGLRVDHPDGLYDPTQYLKRIRQKKPGLIWIEKILVREESIPQKWQVDGTVGYDFLNILSGVFINQKNKQKITKIYDQFIQETLKYDKIYYEKRKKYACLHTAIEIDALGVLLSEKLQQKTNSSGCLRIQDFSQEKLTAACLEMIACYPVYRTYIKSGSLIRKKDREYIKIAVQRAKTKAPKIAPSVFEYIQKLLLSPIKKKWQLDFTLRFQQVTAPVMAKGIEDSAFFSYNRLISLNEVGNSPDSFGFTKEEFHQFNLKKLKFWPLGPLPSSTHDSKYSEDARLRLHVISEIPEKWKSLVFAWRKENKGHFVRLKGELIPEPNTEYMIYQMLLAIGIAEPDRLWTSLQKAIREAGCFTSWREINEDYENAVKHFLFALVKTPSQKFLEFQKEVAAMSDWSSLSALVLKIGSCGVFSIYQGDELMNFSLMDPDNRRAVDFEKRKKELSELKSLKIHITKKGLQFRRENKNLFLKGDYIPLKTPHSVIAFVRKWKKEEILVIASRFFAENNKKGHIKLPTRFHGQTFQDLFTDKRMTMSKQGIILTEVFDPYPFTILKKIRPSQLNYKHKKAD